jgi:hypothetical protein
VPAVLGIGVTLIVLGGGVLAGGAFALLSARRHPRPASPAVPRPPRSQTVRGARLPPGAAAAQSSDSCGSIAKWA